MSLKQEVALITSEMAIVKGIFSQTVDILPSFNITDSNVLPYGLKAHTRSISWIVEQVITQQTKYHAKRLGLHGVEIDMPDTSLHDCVLHKDGQRFFVNVKIHNAEGRENKNDIAAVEKLYMQYNANSNYRLIYAAFGVKFQNLTISFVKDYVHVFSPQFLPIYVNPRNDKIQAFYHHEPAYRTRRDFLQQLRERSRTHSVGMMNKTEWLDQVLNQDALEGIKMLPDHSVDLVIADPPYGLGKDYGNDSDKKEYAAFLHWTEQWLQLVIPKLKSSGSLYIFTTWRYSPEIFVFLKSRMTMVNEIIWDRKVPSMGGSTRKYSSVHDTIGFFVKSKNYYFDIDAVRIPYDQETKKARTRSIFVGKKWLEVGYNPKDVWTVSRLHRIHSEREDHPTQKPLEIIERMVKASCPENGLVLDPFAGSGTTVAACLLNHRHFVAFEINPKYYKTIQHRIERIQNGTYDVTPTAARNGNNGHQNKKSGASSRKRHKRKTPDAQSTLF